MLLHIRFELDGACGLDPPHNILIEIIAYTGWGGETYTAAQLLIGV
ncbi:MAG: hypothetical protein ACTXOO_02490 [Sodalis sp. (in: enterobacteria)]